MLSKTNSLPDLIDLYLTSCRIEGKTRDTIRSYRETLKHFMRAVDAEGLPRDPRAFITAHVYLFLGYVADTGVSSMTQWRRQRETRAFFSWLLRHDYIPTNPFTKVKNIKVPQKLIQPFSQEEVLTLLACCDPDSRKGARDRALILVLLDTGLRAGELATLQREDVDFQGQRMRVRHGKGNRQRVVRFGEEAALALQHYLQRFRGEKPGPVFLTWRHKPLCRTAMRTIFQRLGERAGVTKVHPHRFRHTFATWAIEQQAREIDVQVLLGHSTPAMLRRYTATYDAEKAAQAHASFSPGDRLKGRMGRANGSGEPPIFLKFP